MQLCLITPIWFTSIQLPFHSTSWVHFNSFTSKLDLDLQHNQSHLIQFNSTSLVHFNSFTSKLDLDLTT